LWNKCVDIGIEQQQIQKMEKELPEEEKKMEAKNEQELTFEEGIQGKAMMQGHVDKWFIDKGFGFLNVKGKTVFCHADRVVGQDWLGIREKVWVKIVEDKTRKEESWKAVEAWQGPRWEEELARKKAKEAMDVAAKAARIAAQSMQKSKEMMESAEDAKMRVNVVAPQPGNQNDLNQCQAGNQFGKASKGFGKSMFPGKGKGLFYGDCNMLNVVAPPLGINQNVPNQSMNQNTVGPNQGGQTFNGNAIQNMFQNAALIEEIFKDLERQMKYRWNEKRETGSKREDGWLFDDLEKEMLEMGKRNGLDMNLKTFRKRLDDMMEEEEKTNKFPKDMDVEAQGSTLPRAGQQTQAGFGIGDKVAWNHWDKNIPHGSVGTVVRFLSDVPENMDPSRMIVVVFRGKVGKYRFRPDELTKRTGHGGLDLDGWKIHESITHRPGCYYYFNEKTRQHKWIDEDEDDEDTEDEVQIAGVFGKLAEIEDGLNSRAQESLEKMGRGPAAELLGKISDKEGAIRNPDKYVTTSANRWIKDQEGSENQDCPQQGGDAGMEQWQPSPYTPWNDDDDDDYQGENKEVPEQEWHEDKEDGGQEEGGHEEVGWDNAPEEDGHEEAGWDDAQEEDGHEEAEWDDADYYEDDEGWW